MFAKIYDQKLHRKHFKVVFSVLIKQMEYLEVSEVIKAKQGLYEQIKVLF